jgi:hypothetical protein
MPDCCLVGLSAEGCGCRIGGAGWRDRLTGPRHPLRVVRCRVHGAAFTLYPEGHVPYGREPVLRVADEGGEVDTRSSLLGAAVAASRGERWPEELIEDEEGPVQRTQRRRVQRGAWAVGLDGPVVDSAVLAELGLDAVACTGTVAARVAVLADKGSDPGLWLRIVGAIDLVGRYGPVGVMEGLRGRRLAAARSSFVRALRGPPAVAGRVARKCPGSRPDGLLPSPPRRSRPRLGS